MASARTRTPKTTLLALATAKRQARALELRTEGKSFDTIAAELGYSSRSAAHKAVVSALRDTIAEPAEDVRRLELARLDRLYENALQVAEESEDEKARVGAISAAVKVQERRARLLGLDAPTKTLVGFGLDKLSDAELEQRARELAAKISGSS